ncbi:MAG: rhodanese-like domain-containing protein [Bacteroidetes bacterium]|nr:rhodanese-like domain-containing protein [Bacteroidota bacterium]
MSPIQLQDVKKKLENDNTILIEVLDEDSYKAEHIKGAINIPLKRIGTVAKDKFNKDDEIIVYCSDYSCSASPTAAKKLDDLGFRNVYDFEGGKKEWKDAGLPME